MPQHGFHQMIGRAILPTIIAPGYFPITHTILNSPDCAPGEGHIISLFANAGERGEPMKLANVDMIIAEVGTAKVIIEIEESNVKPIQIIGKYFSAAFSDCYRVYGGYESLAPIADNVLFIQFIRVGPSRGSKKREQWSQIERFIQSVPQLIGQRIWKYRLFCADKDELHYGSEKAIAWSKYIGEFLKQNP